MELLFSLIRCEHTGKLFTFLKRTLQLWVITTNPFICCSFSLTGNHTIQLKRGTKGVFLHQRIILKLSKVQNMSNRFYLLPPRCHSRTPPQRPAGRCHSEGPQQWCGQSLVVLRGNLAELGPWTQQVGPCCNHWRTPGRLDFLCWGGTKWFQLTKVDKTWL